MSDDPSDDREGTAEEPVPENGASGSSTDDVEDEAPSADETDPTDEEVPEWARGDEADDTAGDDEAPGEDGESDDVAATDTRDGTDADDGGDEDDASPGGDDGDEADEDDASPDERDATDRDQAIYDAAEEDERAVYRSLEGENEPDPPTYGNAGSEADADDDATPEYGDRSPIERKAGPSQDQEQPLADHVEEMIRRLAIVALVVAGVTVLLFPFAEQVITFLWYSVLPNDVAQPHVYHPLELLFTQLKVASLAGIVLALPVLVYETYAFMRPGLYPHERRYYLAAVPTSLFLALLGLLFGYFLVLPAIMGYFLYYSQDVVQIAFALGQTFDLMLTLLGYLAIVFQIPLFVMLAIMMGLTSRQWLEDRRLIFWGVFVGVAFLFTPDPTGMAPLLVGGTMIGLYEATLFLHRWVSRD